MPETTVEAVMVRRPKTMPSSASVADVRLAFADDHVHMLLLTTGDRLCGTLIRSDISGSTPGTNPALPHARLSRRTVPPTARTEDVHRAMLAAGLRRYAVVDDVGVLLGLLCLKTRRTGFCSDQDVESRARRRRPDTGRRSASPVHGDVPHHSALT